MTWINRAFTASGRTGFVIVGILGAALFLFLLFFVISLQGESQIQRDVKTLKTEVDKRVESQQQLRSEMDRTKTQFCDIILTNDKVLVIPRHIMDDCSPHVLAPDYADKVEDRPENTKKRIPIQHPSTSPGNPKE